MKKVYDKPNAVITTFDSVDTTSVNVARSAAAPNSANVKKVKTSTNQLG